MSSGVEKAHWQNDDNVENVEEKYDKSHKAVNEKELQGTVEVLPPSYDDQEGFYDAARFHVHATQKDLAEAEAQLDTMPLARALKILRNVHLMHKHDQNFDIDTLQVIEEFINNPEVETHPEKYKELIHAMRLQALLVTNNSPYAMVRGVVDVTDDPETPSLTLRVWLLGILACGVGSLVNQLFTIRYPSIAIDSSTIQLVAYPLGCFLARCLPDWGFTLFGRRHSLNPGPFNRKEHMLITIMSNTGMSEPYTTNVIFIQALEKWYGESYAMAFGYQLLNTLGSQLAGYGLAGLSRSFLVYPSYCVWPSKLSTLALNKGFHHDEASLVAGPFNRMYRWSRMKLFYVAFGAMFVYFWFPNTIFTKLTIFNWIAWIKPTSPSLTRWTSLTTGLGINPFPTLDWNYGFLINTPAFAVNSAFFGMFISMWVIVGLYYTNTWFAGHLPMMSNNTFNNKAKSYDVKKIIDEHTRFDYSKYQQYSEPYMAASNLSNYFFFFAKYTAVITYTPLYHWHELKIGFKQLGKSLMKPFRKTTKTEVTEEEADAIGEDIHFRLMQKYKEAPEWWYLIVLVLSLVFGMVGVGVYPTETTPGVVIYGVAFALVFMVPLGIVMAVTGSTPTLNVLAEFIGGCFDPGNALQMNYFKMYGYITAAHAIVFAGDLKLGHYTKIPPRHTFMVQVVGALVNCFVVTGIMYFQLRMDGVCTDDAPFRFTCLNQVTFFTATVFWGTLGPTRIFGKDGRFKYLCLGFALGPLIVLLVWFLQKKFPKNKLLRSIHTVAILNGAYWYPTTIGEYWSYVWTTMLSWWYIKGRFLAFWSKYNYILSSALSTGVAISALVQFVALGFLPEDTPTGPEWWGTANEVACNVRGTAKCALFPMPDKGYFGPEPGNFH